jgi:rod shape-determining protein MreD
MRPTDRNHDWFDLALCVFTVIAGLLLYAAPTRLIDGPDIMPAWPLMAIFLWSGMRPRFMPPVIIFLIGLTQDLLTQSPLGVWAFSYMAAIALTRFRGDDGMPRDLPPIWLRFCLAMGAASLIAFGLGAWAVDGLPDWRKLLIESLSSILMFPLIAFVSLRRRRGSRSGLIGG